MRRTILAVTASLLALVAFAPGAVLGAGPPAPPQGTQDDAAYAASYQARGVGNVTATTQAVSCYTPEVPYFTSNGPGNGYSGMSPCPGATTGEQLGPYPTQAGSNPGFPAGGPMLVKDHSESDIRVDPTNPRHVIGSSKWIVSPEGYNHLLGFYESWDGGKTWPVQGHIPGYEGWTDNTDPVGAFDRYGNYYELNLAYQFFYNADGSHNFQINPNQEPNPSQPAEVISAAVRPKGSTTSTQWLTTHSGGADIVAPYAPRGHEPDKQWITIDSDPASPFVDTIYAMWVDFTGPRTAHPYVAVARALPDGTHTDWSAPIPLPQVPATANGATYLLPHVTPDGTIWTTLTTTSPAQQYSFDTIFLDKSSDGGQTWQSVSVIGDNIPAPPGAFANTTFRDGIEDTFAVGHTPINGHYPLYVSWEDYSAGVDSVMLAGSFDGGQTWTAPIRVNDNASAVDEFQPNLAVTGSGRVSVAFYDRRLPCPAQGTSEASGAGIALDPNAPYGASNYCVNASVQFYDASLNPLGHNVRLTAHTWDPQLNAPHPGSAAGTRTFIGDYFGNSSSGSTDLFTFVSTYDGGPNPQHQQQQVVATAPIP